MATPFTHKKLSEVEDSAAGFGLEGVQEARFATGDLDAEDTGVSHHTLKAGKRQGFAHRHDKAEEVYYVVSGSGRMKLDDEVLEIAELDAIRVSAGVTRQFEADDGADLVFIAFGPRHEGDGEIVKEWWTD